MAVDMKAALTRKLGPLPAWGWGVALGGGILAWRFVRGGAPSGEQAAASGEPTFVNPPIGGQAYNSEGFLSALPAALDALPDQIATAVVNAQRETITPAPVDWGAFRIMAPPAVSALPSAPPKVIASPTPAPSASTPIPKAGGYTGPVGAPSGGSNVYYAKAGDTLDAIAARFGITGGGDALYRINQKNVTGRYDVHAGQGITLWL